MRWLLTGAFWLGLAFIILAEKVFAPALLPSADATTPSGLGLVAPVLVPVGRPAPALPVVAAPAIPRLQTAASTPSLIEDCRILAAAAAAWDWSVWNTTTSADWCVTATPRITTAVDAGSGVWRVVGLDIA